MSIQEQISTLSTADISQQFEREVRRAGLPPIRLHDLRHTHATIALRAGVPVKVISKRLGHEDPAFTMKQYAHVIPGMQAEAAELIASLVANSRPATS
jgi:integrase